MNDAGCIGHSSSEKHTIWYLLARKNGIFLSPCCRD